MKNTLKILSIVILMQVFYLEVKANTKVVKTTSNIKINVLDQSCCLTIALNAVSYLHDIAYSALTYCAFNGGTNCASSYNNFTAAGMAFILDQADACEAGDGGMQCGG